MTEQEFSCVLNDGGPYGMRIKGGLEFGCAVSVDNVNPGSKSDRAGLKQGDVIISINDTEVAGLTHDATKSLIAKSGAKLEIKVRRGGSINPVIKPESSEQSKTVKSSETVNKPSLTQQLYNNKNSEQEDKTQKNTNNSYNSNPPPKAKIVLPDVSIVNDRVNNKSSDKLMSEANAGTCLKCGQKIGSTKYLKLDNRMWHIEHFQCESCNIVLASSGFYEENNKILCKACYGDIYAPKCNICSKPCVEAYLNSNDRSYHSACFKCKKCQCPLSGKPLNFHENFPHCMDCFSDILSLKCDGCAKPIRPSEQYLEIKNKQYHDTCFRCSICNESLASKGKYLIKDNLPCCPNH